MYLPCLGGPEVSYLMPRVVAWNECLEHMAQVLPSEPGFASPRSQAAVSPLTPSSAWSLMPEDGPQA